MLTLAAATPSPWVGVMWFGIFAAVGLFVAWRLRLNLANGRTPGRSSPSQQRVTMWLALALGLATAALTVRELLRAVF